MSWSEIRGYSGFLHLYDKAVAEARQGAIFVEVGVALGHSVAYLARRLIDAGRDDVRVYAVDPWAGTGRNGEQQEALGDAKGGDFGLFLRTMLEHAPEELERIHVIRATSHEAAPMFYRVVQPIVDLALIDGAHDFDSVLSDISDWRDLVREGGILAGDDHEPRYPDVEAACVEAFGAGQYDVVGTTWIKRI